MIFFDVGANDGSTFLEMAKNQPNNLFYLFEPTPRMCEIIKSKIMDFNLNNFVLVEKAVSDFEGRAKFNVAGQADWGCRSLLNFSEKSKTE